MTERFTPRLQIAASVLAARGPLEDAVARAEQAGVDRIHVDVMDGRFVPQVRYDESDVARIRQCTSLPVDVHLMVSHPVPWLEAMAEAGATSVLIHAESVGLLDATLDRARAVGLEAGIAVRYNSRLIDLAGRLGAADHVLLLGVPAGAAGQSMHPTLPGRTQSVAHAIRRQAVPPRITVDGGINRRTIAPVVAAGATIAVVGSGLFGRDDMRAEMAALRGEVTSG